MDEMPYITMDEYILTSEGANDLNDQPGPEQACRCDTSPSCKQICYNSFDQNGAT